MLLRCRHSDGPAGFCVALASVWLCIVSHALADQIPRDRVDEIREALRDPKVDKATLDPLLNALRTPGEMRRALLLTYPVSADESYERLVERFGKAVRDALNDSNPTPSGSSTNTNGTRNAGSVYFHDCRVVA